MNVWDNMSQNYANNLKSDNSGSGNNSGNGGNTPNANGNAGIYTTDANDRTDEFNKNIKPFTEGNANAYYNTASVVEQQREALENNLGTNLLGVNNSIRQIGDQRALQAQQMQNAQANNNNINPINSTRNAVELNTQTNNSIKGAENSYIANQRNVVNQLGVFNNELAQLKGQAKIANK